MTRVTNIPNPELIPPYSLMSKYYREILYYVDYKRWFSYLDSLIDKHAVSLTRVLDISCGEGIYVSHLIDKGVDVYGCDICAPFIEKAKSLVPPEYRSHFWVDDMRSEATDEYTFIVSLHDSVNYLTTEEDLSHFFANTASRLSSGGTLVFDLSTEYNVVNNFHDVTISEELDDHATYFWKSEYDEDTHIITSYIDFLAPPSESDDTSWSMKREVHKQRIWEKNEVLALATPYLNTLGVYGDFTFKPPKKKAEGVNYVLRKP